MRSESWSRTNNVKCDKFCLMTAPITVTRAGLTIEHKAQSHNFADCLFGTVISRSKPSRVRRSIAALFLLALSTKTWVYPPTALGVSFPSSKTPTSYVTELLPSLLTRRPRSSTAGKDRGAKKWQKDDTTSPMSGESGGFRPQYLMR